MTDTQHTYATLTRAIWQHGAQPLLGDRSRKKETVDLFAAMLMADIPAVLHVCDIEAQATNSVYILNTTSFAIEVGDAFLSYWEGDDLPSLQSGVKDYLFETIEQNVEHEHGYGTSEGPQRACSHEDIDWSIEECQYDRMSDINDENDLGEPDLARAAQILSKVISGDTLTVNAARTARRM